MSKYESITLVLSSMALATSVVLGILAFPVVQEYHFGAKLEYYVQSFYNNERQISSVRLNISNHGNRKAEDITISLRTASNRIRLETTPESIFVSPAAQFDLTEQGTVLFLKILRPLQPSDFLEINISDLSVPGNSLRQELHCEISASNAKAIQASHLRMLEEKLWVQ